MRALRTGNSLDWKLKPFVALFITVESDSSHFVPFRTKPVSLYNWHRMIIAE